MLIDVRLGSSFRDPSGFVFRKSGMLLRQVNASYRSSLSLLAESGLYENLTQSGMLIPHTQVDLRLAQTEDAIAVLRPELVRTVSYPYEWCFSQLKDAALVTLQIQRQAIDRGMSLKDASAYNIQFHQGRPVLIDSLSFEPLEDGKPWVAYRQFCQHFLAPLILMSKVDVRLSRLSADYIDGIPLDLASTIAKPKTRWNPSIGMHLHLHAKLQAKEGKNPSSQSSTKTFSKNSLLGLIESLRSLIESLSWKPEGTEWADYYSETNYSSDSMSEKKKLVATYLEGVTPKPAILWDLGANNGEFSSIATSKGIQTVAWDVDPACVEKNYLKRRDDRLMLPLVQDLTNPSPSTGWGLKERDSLIERGPVDCVMALALIHHLAIGNNVPLGEVAGFLSRLSNWLIIEFVPKEDSQVVRMLKSREDIFTHYDQRSFESAFENHFELLRHDQIGSSSRTLYLMRRRADHS